MPHSHAVRRVATQSSNARAAGPRRASSASWALLLLLAAVPLSSPLATADSVTLTTSTLPTKRMDMSAAWDGSHIYLFGGSDDAGSLDSIVRFDPATGAVAVMGARLPTPRAYTSAVWDGSGFYVFGGVDGGQLGDILRYDPSEDRVTRMGATLPTPRSVTSAVWDGQHAYVFGGVGPGNRRDIVRYDPAADAVAVMAGELPTGRQATAAVWDGSHAYVFGGWDGTYQKQIVRYDPVTDSASVMGAALPTGRFFAAAAWDGRAAYVFGGNDGSVQRQIVQYDPAGDRIVVMDAALGSGRDEAGAAWAGHAAYVLGGRTPDGRTDSILRYDPPNKAPVPTIAPAPPAECRDGGATVALDASGSFDPDGDSLTFAWSAPGVTFDDPASATPTARFPLGTNMVRLTVSDGRAISSASARVEVLDTLPPTTTASTEGTAGNDGWWRSAVQVRLEPADACGPVAATRFALDGAEFQEGTSLTVQGEGDHVLAYFSVDAAGNAEAAQALEARIDTVPPIAFVIDPEAGNVYANDAADPLEPSLPVTLVVGDNTVRVDADDATSGVERVELWVDGMLRAVDVDAPYDVVWTASREALGEHALSVLAFDVAGNQAASPTVSATVVPTTIEGFEATVP